MDALAYQQIGIDSIFTASRYCFRIGDHISHQRVILVYWYTNSSAHWCISGVLIWPSIPVCLWTDALIWTLF